MLAKFIGTLNALLTVLLSLSVGIASTAVLGPVGLIRELIADAVFAVTFGGLLAVAIVVQDLLAECLRELGRGSSGEWGDTMIGADAEWDAQYFQPPRLGWELVIRCPISETCRQIGNKRDLISVC